MIANTQISGRRARRWHKDVYRCADGSYVTCKFGTATVGDDYIEVLPRNGILMRYNKTRVVVVAETALSRNATEVVIGGRNRTYTFPSTVTIVREYAFSEIRELVSVVFNDGL